MLDTIKLGTPNCRVFTSLLKIFPGFPSLVSGVPSSACLSWPWTSGRWGGIWAGSSWRHPPLRILHMWILIMWILSTFLQDTRPVYHTESLRKKLVVTLSSLCLQFKPITIPLFCKQPVNSFLELIKQRCIFKQSCNCNGNTYLVKLNLCPNSNIHQVKFLRWYLELSATNSELQLHDGQWCSVSLIMRQPTVPLQVNSIDGGWGAKQHDGSFNGIVSTPERSSKFWGKKTFSEEN